MTLDGLLQNARALLQGMQASLIREALKPHENEILEQQRIQLLEGKDSQWKDMHPFYSEDIKPRGWFNTKESAKRYADWKQTISYPYSVQRKSDAPNLYITGVFHDDLGLELGADSVKVIPDTAYAANIMAKYRTEAFGLSMAKWKVIFEEKGAKDDLIKLIRETLWQ
jgi:hypothetical protein